MRAAVFHALIAHALSPTAVNHPWSPETCCSKSTPFRGLSIRSFMNHHCRSSMHRFVMLTEGHTPVLVQAILIGTPLPLPPSLAFNCGVRASVVLGYDINLDIYTKDRVTMSLNKPWRGRKTLESFFFSSAEHFRVMKPRGSSKKRTTLASEERNQTETNTGMIPRSFLAVLPNTPTFK